MEKNQFNNKVANATKWSAYAEITAKLVGPIVNILLARILTPIEFGVVASITIITSFADIFTDAGFQKYVIQHEFKNEKILNEYSNVAFSSNIILSTIIFLIIVVFRFKLSILIGCPTASTALIVASISILCTSFSSIAIARFRRSLDFKSLFHIRLGSSLIPLFITVPLAFFLKSYWAIVIGSVSQQLFIALMSIFISKYKPKFKIKYKIFKNMVSFSAWNLCETLSIWFAGQANIFIVGSVLSSYYLGLYKTGMSTINSYMSIVTATISPVLFSALSRSQNNDETFKSILFKFQKTIALFIIPMGMGILIYRDLVVQILLGSQWKEIADFMGLWALISSFTITFSNTACEVYRGKGLPKISFILQVIYMFVYIPVIYFSAHVGFGFLCITSCLVRIFPIILDFIVLRTKFGIELFKLLENTFVQFLATGVMSIFAILFVNVTSNIVIQIISVVICIIIYFGVIFCFPQMRKEYGHFLKTRKK